MVERSDKQGVNLYIAGETESTNFPSIHSAEDESIEYDGSKYAGGEGDAFIMTVELTSAIPGDVNGDGVFDSSDLVAVFTAGEYEDDVPGNSTFEEGDWDGDGDFTSSDLVFVFKAGNYVNAAIMPIAADRIFDNFQAGRSNPDSRVDPFAAEQDELSLNLHWASILN